MDYKKLYFELFGKLADIEEALENGDLILAREIIVEIEAATEENYMNGGENS